MDLHSAISRAVKFTWSGNQKSPLRNVRFIPSIPNSLKGGRLYASMGDLAVMIQVDTEVPNLVADGEELAGIVAGTKTLSFVDFENPSLQDESGHSHKVKHRDVSYPAIPQIPGTKQWYTVDGWWAVEQALHVVSKDKQQPHLQCLHFRKNLLVEATDRMRVARVFKPVPLEGMVLAETFKAWPKNLDRVEVALEGNVAWFRLGDETRLSCLCKGSFPDLDKLLPEYPKEGSALGVSTPEITEAIKKVVATKAGSVTVQFSPAAQVVSIEGGTFKAALNAVVIQAPESTTETVTVKVNAKWLQAALRVCRTPRVLLRYDPLQALRIESGPYVEGIWQMAGE